MWNKRGKKSVNAAALCACLLSACMVGCVGSPSTGLVARQDFDANQAWQPPKVMGKDFWNMLYVEVWDYTADGKGVAADGFYFKKLKDTPVYKESGRSYSVNIFNKASDTVTTSEIFRSSWSNWKHGGGHDFLQKVFGQDGNPDAPFFMSVDDARPPWGNPIGEHNYDFAGYGQWKRYHPNFMGFRQPEWCNECLAGPWHPQGIMLFKEGLSKEQLAAAEREFPNPATREAALALIKKLCGALKKFYFNDPEKLTYLRGMCNMDHYAYEWGAEVAWLETSNTACFNSNYTRWQNSLFFARGASHQYNKKWGWYLASYYNGFPAAGGDKVGDTHVSYNYTNKAGKNYGWTGVDFGMSLSLYTRAMYLAYLSGPSFVEHEAIRKFVKDHAFSPWGKALEEWFDFTRRNPRGITYAPVALLVPFEQCYPIFGGRSWFRYNYERPDWMLDAFMYTIAPHNPVTKDGNEGCLSNSPYGDIYDAVLPNTPDNPVSLDVLDKYKVAIMLGRYAKDKALADRLMEYARGGGTLLINIKQLNEFFPESFTGIARDGAARPVKAPVRSLPDGKTFNLPDGYEMETVKLRGATPLLEDAEGKILACENRFGKGNVIVTTVDYLVPKNDMANQGKMDVLKELVQGKEFPFPAYFLGRIVREVLPLEVKGDVEYGLSRVDDGWLLYLINNKGVTKFVDRAQSIDPSKAAKVEVSLKAMRSSGVTELRERRAVMLDEGRNSFAVEVPPGEVRVLKIKD